MLPMNFSMFTIFNRNFPIIWYTLLAAKIIKLNLIKIKKNTVNIFGIFKEIFLYFHEIPNKYHKQKTQKRVKVTNRSQFLVIKGDSMYFLFLILFILLSVSLNVFFSEFLAQTVNPSWTKYAFLGGENLTIRLIFF